MPNLTPRLLAVAEQIPQGARLADIGTDHAYLPVHLLETGRIRHAVATDLRAGPLRRAEENVARYGLTDGVELRLGNGLAPVDPWEVDAVAIAGMGGDTILDILTASPWALEKVCVVQPMSSTEELRRGLERLDGHITLERLIPEGKNLYTVMVLAAGKDAPLTPGECWVGRSDCHRGDPLWPDFLIRELERARKALAGLRQSKRPEDGLRLLELEQITMELTAMAERLEGQGITW